MSTFNACRAFFWNLITLYIMTAPPLGLTSLAFHAQPETVRHDRIDIVGDESTILDFCGGSQDVENHGLSSFGISDTARMAMPPHPPTARLPLGQGLRKAGKLDRVKLSQLSQHIDVIENGNSAPDCTYHASGNNQIVSIFPRLGF